MSEIRVDISDFIKVGRRMVQGLSGSQWKTAIARTMTKTASSARTEASKKIRSKFKIKKSTLEGEKGNKKMGTTRATSTKLTATIFTWGIPIPLRDFKPRTVKNKGVSVDITGTRKIIPHAFIATVKAGNNGATHKGVFARGGYGSGGFKHREGRTGAKPRTKQNKYHDLGITEMVTLSQAAMFDNPTVQQAVISKIHTDFEKNLIHEAEYILSQIRIR